MKYQRLVSNTTPFSLLKYLEDQLEERGIDAVFARYILSILEQDCDDIEPCEQYHTQKQHVKELQKYGSRQTLYSLPKSKNKKWETWDKQLLSSPPLHYNEKCFDTEKLKRDAAVECLRSICDVNDAESLINEVYNRLKNFKNQNGEKEDTSFGKINAVKIENPFYIAPSSPIDDVEKYFAAFPPLNSKVEENTDFNAINISPWYRSCAQEMKYESKIKILNSSDKHITKKINQPVIPYGSLKSIKNVYKCNITHLLANEVNFDCIEKLNCSALKSYTELLDINSPHNVKTLKYLAQKYVRLKANYAELKPHLRTSSWKFLVIFNKLKVCGPIQKMLTNIKNASLENFEVAVNIWLSNLLTDIDGKSIILKSGEIIFKLLDSEFKNSMNIVEPEIADHTISAKVEYKCLERSSVNEFIVQKYPYNQFVPNIGTDFIWLKKNFCLKYVFKQCLRYIYSLLFDCQNVEPYLPLINVFYENIDQIKNLPCSIEKIQAYSNYINTDIYNLHQCGKSKSSFFENLFGGLSCNKLNNEDFWIGFKLLIKDIMVTFSQNYCRDLKYIDLSSSVNICSYIAKTFENVMDRSFFIMHDFQVDGDFLSNKFYEKKIVSSENRLDFGDFQRNIPFISKASIFPFLSSDVNYLEYNISSINKLSSPLSYVHILNACHDAEKFEADDECILSKINHDDNMCKYENFEEYNSDGKTDKFSVPTDATSVLELGAFTGYKLNTENNLLNKNMMDTHLKEKMHRPEESNLHIKVTSENESIFSLKSEDYLSCDDLFNSKYDSHGKILSFDRNTRFSVSENFIEMYSMNILKNLKFGENLPYNESPSVNYDMFPWDDLYSRSYLLSEDVKQDIKMEEYLEKETVLNITDVVHDIFLNMCESKKEFPVLSTICPKYNYDELNFNENGILKSKFSLCEPASLPSNIPLGEYGTFSRNQFYSEHQCNLLCQQRQYLCDFEQSAEDNIPKSSSHLTSELFPLTSQSHVDLVEKNSKLCEKKWLLYWGENQVNVERTWKRDFISPVKSEEKFNQYSQFLNDESHLKNMGRNASKNLNIILNSNEDQISFSQNEDFQEQITFSSNQEVSLQNCNYDVFFQPKNLVENETINQSFNIYCENQAYIPDSNNQSETNTLLNSSAFYPCNNYDVWQADCIEQNEWNNDSNKCVPSSFTENDSAFNDTMPLFSDRSLDFKCDYSFDSSFGFEKFPEQFEHQFSDELDHVQMRCVSESNENNISGTSAEFADCYVEKQRKKKYPHFKRPCCFYLQGSCSRPDCKYSHDVSHITCRFWKQGSCFKGELCPFLHGYVRYNEGFSLDDDGFHDPYSLESEADFPSLECTKIEAPKISKESNPVNIVQDKSSRKKRKKKLQIEHSSI